MIYVHINVMKGEIYRVSQIEFRGNTLFCDDEIRKEFTFGPGCPYSPEEIRETIGNIQDLYGRKGYIDAIVDFEPSLDIDTMTYSLKMVIEEGNQFRVGMLKVFGNTTTQTSIILHESLLIPGEIFNIERLKLTEQKLINVGYFEAVNVFAVKSDGPLGLGENYRDVHIEVKETSTGHFGAFFGYSTAESVFGGINITEKNFNYRGLSCFWQDGWKYLRGGGEYAHATVQVGLKSRKYIASWAKPFFMDTPWTVGFDLERNTNRYIFDDGEINSWSFISHATYKLNQFMHFGWHYRIKRENGFVQKHKRTEGEKVKEESEGEKADREEKEKASQGVISATGVSFTYDSTDHPVTPRCGFKSRLELEYAGLGGSNMFFSFAYLNSYFIPLDKKTIVKYRADFRFILPTGGTKPDRILFDERLYLGGDVLVRGYRSYRLGPQFSDHNPKGGISLQYYSAEITRRLHPKIEGFGYFDAGFLSLHRFRFDEPYCAIGVGARVRIIESIPSITLGYGIPLNAKNRGEIKRFFISLGGQF